MKRIPFAVVLLSLALLTFGGPARAVTQVPEGGVSSADKLTVDVWINKEEGGVYSPGESMRVFFRTSADAYVLVYNIDTDGYIHLVYPYGAADQNRVESGRTYIIPARHDPYELVADGPQGMEFVVAVASRLPFHDLPWYLTSGAPEGEAGHGVGEDEELDSGVIVGDPYVGMERINKRIIPPGSDAESDANDIYFYIEKRVEYPRYVCADCHYSSFGFDPYLSVCPVVDIRIDATWVRYAPVRVGYARPRYYYWVRPGAPERYRAWKERWSSIDGGTALRSRFVVEQSSRAVKSRDLRARREPSEFKDLRRTRPGRLWQGRDEVLRLWEKQRGQVGGKSSPSSGSGKDRARVAPRKPDPGKSVERNKDESQSGDRDRGSSSDNDGKSKDRDQSQDRDKGQDRPKSQDSGKSQDRGHDQSQKQQGPPPKTDAERRERSH